MRKKFKNLKPEHIEDAKKDFFIATIRNNSLLLIGFTFGWMTYTLTTGLTIPLILIILWAINIIYSGYRYHMLIKKS